MKYYSTKTFANDRGLSCCFRQWKAKDSSHCSLLHGYSLGVKFLFECESLDLRDWVMDFGDLKEIKTWLEMMFDHTVLIAQDDPELNFFQEAAAKGNILELRIVPAVGCEKFAEMIFYQMQAILEGKLATNNNWNSSVRVKSVEVFEHGANSAIFVRE